MTEKGHVSGCLVEVGSRLGLHVAAHATINMDGPEPGRCRPNNAARNSLSSGGFFRLRGNEGGHHLRSGASAHTDRHHAPHNHGQSHVYMHSIFLFETLFSVLAIFYLCTPSTTANSHEPRSSIARVSGSIHGCREHTALQSTRGTAPSGFAKCPNHRAQAARHAPHVHLLGTSQPEERAEYHGTEDALNHCINQH